MSHTVLVFSPSSAIPQLCDLGQVTSPWSHNNNALFGIYCGVRTAVSFRKASDPILTPIWEVGLMSTAPTSKGGN